MNEMAKTPETLDDVYLRSLAVEAYIWGYPLVQTGEYRRIGASKNQPINQIVNGPAILSEAYAPCIDVLYGFIFMDLDREPQVLAVPDMAGRYYSFQFIDTFNNSFAYVGSRTTGTGAGAFALAGPGWKGQLPSGVQRIDCTTNEVLVNIRTFVADHDDLPAANAAADSYALGPLSTYPQGLKGTVRSQIPLYEIFPILRFGHHGAKYFDILGDRLKAKPLPPEEENALKKFAALGLGPGQHPSQSEDARLVRALADAVTQAEQRIESCNFADRVNGWDVIYGITSFIKDTQVRAFTSRYGCGYHLSEEALYYHCRVGPDGKPLNGANRYVLRFDKASLPPVHSFWSLSLMDLAMIPVRNPINRYALAGHTQGMRYGADGSLEIPIQHDAPDDPSNWLPSGGGDFFMTLRLYLPKQDAIDGTYKPPQLRIIGRD